MSLSSALSAASVYGGTSTETSGATVAVVLILVVLYLAILGVVVWAYVRVAQKAGFSGWYALVLFVPIVNVVFMLLFAFKPWPVEREVAWLRERVRQLEGSAAALTSSRYGQPPGLSQAPPSAPPGEGWPTGPSGSLG